MRILFITTIIISCLVTVLEQMFVYKILVRKMFLKPYPEHLVSFMQFRTISKKKFLNQTISKEKQEKQENRMKPYAKHLTFSFLFAISNEEISKKKGTKKAYESKQKVKSSKSF